MRVHLWEWRDQLAHRPCAGWVCVGEFHLDDVAEHLVDPMMSVAWDRDLPGLVPQPLLVGPVSLYAPCGGYPARIFPDRRQDLIVHGRLGDVVLAYQDGVWAWRRNGWDDNQQCMPLVSITSHTVVELQQYEPERATVSHWKLS